MNPGFNTGIGVVALREKSFKDTLATLRKQGKYSWSHRGKITGAMLAVIISTFAVFLCPSASAELYFEVSCNNSVKLSGIA